MGEVAEAGEMAGKIERAKSWIAACEKTGNTKAVSYFIAQDLIDALTAGKPVPPFVQVFKEMQACGTWDAATMQRVVETAETLARDAGKAVPGEEREFVRWVETWVSKPVGSHSVMDLNVLFAEAREKIAALLRPAQPEGEGK